jgi:hypothetical protein
MRKFTKPVWFFFAALFLIEAWLWDHLAALFHRLAERIPFEALKQTLTQWLELLPAPAVLLVFLFPLAVLEPLKLGALWLIVHHHIFLGIAAFAAAKFIGLGLVAFLFEMTRHKLLSMAWFAKLYEFVLKIRAMAHAFVEPYKLAIREAIEPLKRRLAATIASFGGGNGFGRRLALLRARVRRARGA